MEISYLIPATFFLLLLLGTTLLAEVRELTTLFLIAILASSLVTIQLAQPNIPGRATNAIIHPSVRPGSMIDDVESRLGLRGCNDEACWGSYALQHGLGPQIAPPSKH